MHALLLYLKIENFTNFNPLKLISQSAAELRREKFFDMDNADDIVFNLNSQINI